MPWRNGRCATWDVTVTDTVAASYLSLTSSCAGLAADAAATRKEDKYLEITSNYLLFPLAFGTFGPISQAGCNFLSSLGRPLTLISDDPRESSFLFSVFTFLFSASIQFVSATHSGTCPPNFFTNRDAPRVSFFPLVSNAFGNEVPGAILKNNKKHSCSAINP